MRIVNEINDSVKSNYVVVVQSFTKQNIDEAKYKLLKTVKTLNIECDVMVVLMMALNQTEKS